MASLYDILNSFPYNVGAEERSKLHAKSSAPKQQIVDPNALFKLRRSKLIDEALKAEDGNITLAHSKALAHWSLFGRESLPSLTRVKAGSWKSQLFKKPMHSVWHLPVPPFQLGKLLNGFYPLEMEDKWYIYADGPDSSGRAMLHMHRSWTGQKNIELEIQTTGDEEEEAEAWSAKIVAVSWETDEELVKCPSEEMAKYEALEACNWCLGVKLVDEIAEPSDWEHLPTFLPRSGQTPTHKGVNMSAGDIEDLHEGDVITMG
ncbi:MAG: hypothetical protein M1813_001727 [Trichoglossum hirsutum]|nr:MAG: hypothetical protein M1813_001727 [Trichoglossum hirsutum]